MESFAECLKISKEATLKAVAIRSKLCFWTLTMPAIILNPMWSWSVVRATSAVLRRTGCTIDLYASWNSWGVSHPPDLASENSVVHLMKDRFFTWTSTLRKLHGALAHICSPRSFFKWLTWVGNLLCMDIDCWLQLSRSSSISLSSQTCQFHTEEAVEEKSKPRRGEESLLHTVYKICNFRWTWFKNLKFELCKIWLNSHKHSLHSKYCISWGGRSRYLVHQQLQPLQLALNTLT